MIRYIFTILVCLHLCNLAWAGAPIKIAILDTGLSGNYKGNHLCSRGHFDFIDNEPNVGIDDIEHGTRVAQIIERVAGPSHSYCLLIYKVGRSTLVPKYIVQAFAKAKLAGAQVYNLSYSGFGPNPGERKFMIDNPGLTFVVAAGNNGMNLTRESCNIYPTCYLLKNVVSVGSKGTWFSNYGPVIRVWVNTAEATSFAAAVATGTIVKQAIKLGGLK